MDGSVVWQWIGESVGEAHWIVEFEYRSDDGPRSVGWWPTKEAAWAWLKAQTFDHSGSCIPVTVVAS